VATDRDEWGVAAAWLGKQAGNGAYRFANIAHLDSMLSAYHRNRAVYNCV